MSFKFMNYVMYYNYSEIVDGPINIDEYEKVKFVLNPRSDLYCFSSLYRDLEKENKKSTYFITIDLYRSMDIILKECRNHLLLFSKKDTIFWINEIRRIIPFEYKIVKESQNKNRLDMLITGSVRDIKFATTLIRALVEWPISHILKESITLKRSGILGDISLFNIFVMMSSFGFNINSGHCVMPFAIIISKVLSHKEIKDILDRAQGCHISGVLPGIPRNGVFKIELASECVKSFVEETDNKETLSSIIQFYNKKKTMDRYEKFYKPIFEEIFKNIKYKNE